MYEVRISKTSIDNTLYEVKKKLWEMTGEERETNRIIEPLIWYICTGRASIPFIKKLVNMNKREITVIAKRLCKFGGWNTDAAVKSIKNYLLPKEKDL